MSRKPRPGCFRDRYRILPFSRMRCGTSCYFFAQIARAFMPVGLSLVEKQ
jgi:hypothetical protein